VDLELELRVAAIADGRNTGYKQIGWQ